jgi:CubicO group peptidase (beta-lactamase class C family)
MAVGVVKNDKIIFQKYYGRENLESEKKVDANSLFRVYSTTKLITNVAVFQLIEKVNCLLEDNISKYLIIFQRVARCENKKPIVAFIWHSRF